MYFSLRKGELENCLAMGKRLLVLGASGQTGQQLVKQALERNHHVTALVRFMLVCSLLQVVVLSRHRSRLLPSIVHVGMDEKLFCNIYSRQTLEKIYEYIPPSSP
jgi:dTDP-4-dehydrorhamnose reductase